jgi:hypothetical protein
MNMQAIAVILLAAGAAALLGHAVPRSRSAPSVTVIASLVMIGVVWILFDRAAGIGFGLVEFALLGVSTFASGAVAAIASAAPVEPDTVHDADLDGIRAASACRTRAHHALVEFTEARSAMTLQERLVDSFVTSNDEELRDHAERNIASCDAQLADIVPRWTTQEAYGTLAKDLADTEAHQEAIRAHRPHRALVDAATGLHGLAVVAEAHLDEAISDLSSASTMETLDAVSSNKAIALMSHSQNQTASDSVREAQASIERLQAETRRVGAQLTGIDDTLDLVMDLAFDGVFDFMSFINIGRIDAARRKCEEAIVQVRQERLRLHGLLERAVRDAQPTLQAVDAITARHLAMAVARLPRDVRALAPVTLPLPDEDHA